MHIKLGQCEEKRGSDHTSKLWPPGWFHLLRGPFCFSLFRSHFPFFTLSLHLLSSAHFSDSCEHQDITSYAFWRAAFQNNTQQSFILVTKRTFPWRLPLQNKKKNRQCWVQSYIWFPLTGSTASLLTLSTGPANAGWLVLSVSFGGCRACDASAKAR